MVTTIFSHQYLSTKSLVFKIKNDKNQFWSDFSYDTSSKIDEN
jgi:hypothetical protein